MKLLSIAIKDTKVLIRDWKALTILIAMPFILISLLGMALGSMWSGESGISKFDVGVVNVDQGDLASVFIKDVLKSKDMAKMLNVTEVSESEARKNVESGDLAAAIIIPKGFTEKVMSGQNASMEVLGDPGQEVRAGIIRSIANAYASRLSSVMIGASIPVGALIQAGAVPPDAAFQGQMTRQATMLGFNDAFLVIAATLACVLVLVFFMQRPEEEGGEGKP